MERLAGLGQVFEVLLDDRLVRQVEEELDGCESKMFLLLNSVFGFLGVAL